MNRISLDIFKFNTFGIKGEMKIFFPERNQELTEITDDIRVIGNGSNLLINTESKTSLINLCKFNKISKETNSVIVDAGVNVFNFLNFCINNSISGFNFLAGIPGTIGGLIVMNAGSYGHEIMEFIQAVEFYDVEKKCILKKNIDEIDFSYRNSSFLIERNIVLRVWLKIRQGKNSEDVRKDIINNFKLKKSNQPIFDKTFGSIFKNPEGNSAWKLIKDAGMSGINKNDAYISNKHANFMVNRGNATFGDAVYLIELIKENVYNRFNIELEEEVEYIN